MISVVAGRPRLFADFQNADQTGRVRLTTSGTTRDIEKLGIRLRDGLEITLCEPGELEADGTVLWSTDERIWVVEIGPIRHLD